MEIDETPEINTAINLLAYMVVNTQVSADVLIKIFESLPLSEQVKVRQVFNDVGGSFGN